VAIPWICWGIRDYAVLYRIALSTQIEYTIQNIQYTIYNLEITEMREVTEIDPHVKYDMMHDMTLSYNPWDGHLIWILNQSGNYDRWTAFIPAWCLKFRFLVKKESMILWIVFSGNIFWLPKLLGFYWQGAQFNNGSVGWSYSPSICGSSFLKLPEISGGICRLPSFLRAGTCEEEIAHLKKNGGWQ